MTDAELRRHGLIPPPARLPIPGVPQSVAALLDPAVAAAPGREALVGRHARYTYAELDLEVNRAAHALGRHYPGGMPAFVEAMNRKAQALGMKDTHYVEPTGLSSRNQSNAADLALLVREANKHDLIRRLSTTHEAAVAVGRRSLQFRNTNSLVRSDAWDIELSKTGYLDVAGRCLVMHMRIASRDLVVVLLDSWGKYTRIADARRIRKWLETSAARDPQS